VRTVEPGDFLPAGEEPPANWWVDFDGRVYPNINLGCDDCESEVASQPSRPFRARCWLPHRDLIEATLLCGLFVVTLLVGLSIQLFVSHASASHPHSRPLAVGEASQTVVAGSQVPIQVRLDQVVSPALPGLQQEQIVGLRLTIEAPTSVVRLMPNGMATLVGSDGLPYEASPLSLPSCPSFPKTINLAGRSSQTGCLLFELPLSVSPHELHVGSLVFSLSSSH